MQRIVTFVVLLMTFAVASLGTCLAQSLGSDQLGTPLSSEERQQLLQDLAPLVPPAAPSPGMTFGTPTAFGTSGGRAFFGLSGIAYFDNDANDDDADDVDGSMVFGAGFGHAVDSVGLEVAVGIISLTDDFGDSGNIGVKLHKAFPESGFGVAVGWANALTWGDADDAEDTVYAVASKNYEHASISLGVGTGTFRTTDDVEEDDNNLNVFGSVGVRLHPRLSLISSWTGSQLNVGFGVAPFDFPLKATLGVTDVTEEKDAGSAFSMNVGYSFAY